MIAEVIVDIATSEVDKIFDYVCDGETKEGSRVRVPFGNTHVTGFVVGIKNDSVYPMEKLKRVEEVYDGIPALNEECLSLAKKISERYRTPMALSLRLFLPAEMRTGKVKEIYRKIVVLKERDAEFSASAVKQKEIFDYLLSAQTAEYAFLTKKFSASALKALVEKGIVGIERERKQRVPYRAVEEKGEKRLLTAEQQFALKSIRASAQTVQLLHGVTGSGKTEIYLNYIAEQVKEGRSAIFLVPEISLTPQMLSQLRARFSSSVAILHSGLSAGERFDEWQRMRTGEAKIAVGARSAIFAPLENLGAIIIDEEHDSSYFSESAPRYSTLEVAKIRAETNNCKLILGSATPSVESYLKAKRGEYNLIRLKKRINEKPMPEIILTDMRREVRRGNNTIFSTALKEQLEETLSSGNQAILFLNRRGYSQSVICTECGYVAKCEHCDVALTYHSEENCLKCHYCGTKYRMLTACPECGGVRLNYFGTGTQRIARELSKLFPAARIIRMDNDTTSGKEGHYKILKDFASHKADILIGTQMIAKGHDFPSVTLVGILDADMSLHFSDYRSGERTFQLITQVAGRSGRGKEKGKVVLQTYDPQNAILQYAIRYDYDSFFENEIALRQGACFPPFALIVRVMITSESEEKAVEVLKKVYFELEAIYQANSEKFTFFNKMRAPIKRIQNNERFQVLMRLKDNELLPQIYAVCAESKTKDVLVSVEENPGNLT